MRQSTDRLFPGGLQRAHAQTRNVPERGHLQETGSKAKIQKREAGGGLPRETVMNPEWARRGPGAACWNLVRAAGLTVAAGAKASGRQWMPPAKELSGILHEPIYALKPNEGSWLSRAATGRIKRFSL